MMPQAWFEMAEIRRRKFSSSAWIPLRAVQPICELGKRGHLGFKDEFFGAGSFAVSVAPEEARHALTLLVGTYQLRLADAHLPGSELAEAMKLAGIDSSNPSLHQGQTLIANCAAAGAVVASLLERLANSTCKESHGTK